MLSIKETIKKIVAVITLYFFIYSQITFPVYGEIKGENRDKDSLTINEIEKEIKRDLAKKVSFNSLNKSGSIAFGFSGGVGSGVSTINERRNIEEKREIKVSREEYWKERGFKVIEGREVEVDKDTRVVLKYNDVVVEIEEGSVKDKTVIVIEELKEVNKLNPGMENVTQKVAGYRFLPDGMKFEKNIKVSLPYDRSKVMGEEDIATLYTYFYDEESKRWEKLERVEIDEKNGIITSLTNHFTDLINSTLKLPESPKPLSFNPNSIKDIKAANPASNIPEIKGLEASPYGAASFSLPLNIPAGRNGLTPKLSIDYNSGGGNGWLGVGFDINIPCISIDTRFGLPTYDDTKDTYLLNGEELVLVDSNYGGKDYKLYRKRVENDFQRIVKKGDIFEVTDKDGTVTIYGEEDSNLNKYKLYVKSITDSNGNTIIYEYITDENYKYLSKIEYTGHISGEEGKYVIEFTSEDGREDVTVDARGKFVSKNQKRLKSIEIKYNGGLIRRYDLSYSNEEKLYFKSHITKITEYDDKENEFYSYEFDYYEKPKKEEMFEDATWDVVGSLSDKSLAVSHNIGGGGGAYIGVGLAFGAFGFGIGCNFGFQLETGFDEVIFMDFNGDGLPDLVGKTGNNIKVLLNDGEGLFGGRGNELNINNFPYLFNNTLNPSFNIGGSADVNVGDTISVNGNVGGSFSWANALNKFIDINGDGIIDFIPSPTADKYERGVWRKGDGLIEFKKSDWGVIENTPVMLDVSADVSSISDQSSDKKISSDDFNKGFNLLDPVIKWRAYHSGRVKAIVSASKVDDFMKNSDETGDGIKVGLYYGNTKKEADLLQNGDTITLDLTVDLINRGENIYLKSNSKDNIANDTVVINPEIKYESIKFFDDMVDYDVAYLKSRYNEEEFNLIIGKIKYSEEISFFRNCFNKINIGSGEADIYEYQIKNLREEELIRLREILVFNGIVVPKKLSKESYENILFTFIEVIDTENGEEVKIVNEALFNDFKDSYVLDASGKYALTASEEKKFSLLKIFTDLNFSFNEQKDSIFYNYFTDKKAVVHKSSNDSNEYFISNTNEKMINEYAILKNSEVDSIGEMCEKGVLVGVEKDINGEVIVREWVKGNGIVVNGNVSKYIVTKENQNGEVIESREIYPTNNMLLFDENDSKVTKRNNISIGYNTCWAVNAETYNTIISNALPESISKIEYNNIIAKLKSDEKSCFSQYYVQNPNDKRYYLNIIDITDENNEVIVNNLKNFFNTVISVTKVSLPSKIYYETYVKLRETEIRSYLTKSEFDNIQNSSLLTEDKKNVIKTYYKQKQNSPDTNYYLKEGINEINILDKEAIIYVLGEMNIIAKLYTRSIDSEYYVIINSSATAPVLRNKILENGLAYFSFINKRVDIKNSGLYDTSEVAYEEGIEEDVVTEKEYEGKKHNLTSSISVLTMDDDLVCKLENRYIHIFKLINDFSEIDITTYTLEKLSLIKQDSSSVIEGDAGSYDDKKTEGLKDKLGSKLNEVKSGEPFSGGVYGWFYGEWNGNKEWDESKIGEKDEFSFYLSKMQYVAKDGKVKNVSSDDIKENLPEDATTDIEVSTMQRENPWGLDMWAGTDSSYLDRYFDENGEQKEEVRNFITYIGRNSENQIILCPSKKAGDSTEKAMAAANRVKTIRLDKLNFLSNTFTMALNLGGGATIKGFPLSAGVSYNKGESYTYNDLFDINGDRYPDQVTANGKKVVAIYNKGGGFKGVKAFDIILPGVRISKNENFGLNAAVGASNDVMMTVTDPDGNNTRVKSGNSISWGGNVSGGGGYSQKLVDFIDINGDGLADYINKEGRVQLNCGDERFQNGFDENINTPLTHSNTLNANFGLTVGTSGLIAVGLSAGVTGSTTVSVSNTNVSKDLIDINGDGLLDIVEKNHNENFFKVKYNLGNSFSSQYVWVTPIWDLSFDSSRIGVNSNSDFGSFFGGMTEIITSKYNAINKNNYVVFGAADTISHTGNFGVSVGVSIPIKIGIYMWLSVYITPNVNFSYGQSNTQLMMIDINGDGLPDRVFKNSWSNQVKVQLNKAQKVGLLKEIKTPIGGKIKLEYERTKNTPDMPNSQWVLSKVIRYDNKDDIEADDDDGSVKKYETTFEYLNGFYHRLERTFYGFEKVTQINPDGTRTETIYDNQHYFTKGKPQTITFYDTKGEERQKTENIYNYYVYNKNEEFVLINPDVFFDEETETYNNEKIENGSFFPMLSKVITTNYDPQHLTHISKAMEYTKIDKYGNITEAIDRGDENNNYDDVVIKIEYNYITDSGKYIVSKPKKLDVTSITGKLLRNRIASYDNNNGNMLSLSQYLKDEVNGISGRYITTNFEYDNYGNIIKVTDPKGYCIEYQYDDNVHSFIKTIKDKAEYTSTAEYDYRFGVETITYDINNNKIEKVYDEFGRLKEVWTSYDYVGENKGMTSAIKCEYCHNEFPLRAVTYNKVHFDPTDTETLETVIVIDGLGRVIQTKKEGEVLLPGDEEPTYGMNVTGRIVYDNMGRVIKQGQPVFQRGYDLNYCQDVVLQRPTITEYDDLGRVIRTILPDGAIITNEYIIENNLYKTIVTDPKGNKKISYSDVDENIIKIEQFNKGETITTQYKYNLLNEIIEVIDTKGYKTEISYDTLGRRTSINNPDSGLIKYRYDDVGNIVEKEDNNLRAISQMIRYEYDEYNRLRKIDYPTMTDVEYEYGGVTAENNSKGRLVSIKDESGVVTFEYGKLGEQVKVKKVLNALGSSEKYTFEFSYLYDYLGRIESIGYPVHKSGQAPEIVKYEYDKGGQIKRVTGKYSDNTNDFVYVDKIYYDEFGQRVFVEYGNGVATRYVYDENRRWLTNILTKDKTGNTIQNINYTFDRVGNIEQIVNDKFKYKSYTNSVSQKFEYDDLYQLIKAEGDYYNEELKKTNRYTQNFKYDIIGNMTEKISTNKYIYSGGGGGININDKGLNYSFVYEYDKNKPHQLTKINDILYKYDENGNVRKKYKLKQTTSGGASTGSSVVLTDPNSADEAFGYEWSNAGSNELILAEYKWDEENRLKEAITGNTKVKFLYNAGGERTVKYVINQREILYADKLYQRQIGLDSDCITKHIFVGETRVVSKVTYENLDNNAPVEKENVYYYHQDHLGSSNFITDYQGNIYEHIEYTPYGETWVEESNDTMSYINYKFTSKEFDEETGLYYFGARYLDAKVSRWMSADPIYDGVKGGLSIYAYGGNNPIKYYDPNGLWIDNGDGTYTAEEGDTLWGLYGKDWKEKSGYTGDPRKLQPGTIVGKKKENKSENDSSNNNFGNSRLRNLPSDVKDNLDKYGKVTYQFQDEDIYESLGARLKITASVGVTLGKGNVEAIFTNKRFEAWASEYSTILKKVSYVVTTDGKFYFKWNFYESESYFGINGDGFYWGKKFIGSDGLFFDTSYTYTFKPEPIIFTALIVAGVYRLVTIGDTSLIQRGLEYAK